jgi:hypothetical protein
VVDLPTSKINQCDSPLRHAKTNEFFNTISPKFQMLRG